MSALITPPQVFRADHPFIFAIRNRSTNTILFLGEVTNPGTNPLYAATRPISDDPGTPNSPIGLWGLQNFPIKRAISWPPYGSVPAAPPATTPPAAATPAPTTPSPAVNPVVTAPIATIVPASIATPGAIAVASAVGDVLSSDSGRFDL
jgi:hypothetical protein